MKTSAVLLSAVLSFGAQHLAASAFYNVTALGTLGGSQSYGYGINQAGQVTGSSLTASGDEHAFLYSNGQMQDLGTLDGPQSVGTSVNSLGQVAGIARNSPTNGDWTGFVYANGQMGSLGTLTNANTLQTGINDSGQVTGTSYTDSNTPQAFLYADGRREALPSLGSGNGINDAGQIVGSAQVDGATHAVLYANGQLRDLGTLPGGQSSLGNAVNNQGQVTGISYSSTGSALSQNVNHAFLYANGQLQDLGTLGGYISTGQAINDFGVVVGSSSTSTADSAVSAFVYSGGQMLNLNSFIDPSMNPGLTTATAVNNSGQIVAEGADNRAYLLTPTLTPTPEPGTVWMVLAALGLALGARKISLRH